MRINRRHFLYMSTASVTGLHRGLVFANVPPTDHKSWTAEWNAACLDGVLHAYDLNYDANEYMIRGRRGPEYNYQSNLRNTIVHPTRDSFEYALVLLEEGGSQRIERALQVLDRTLALQDSDPGSKWFGLWSYYLEESLPMMGAVDFNWADFNGATLLLILLRHAEAIPSSMRERMLQAVDRACISILKRDVSVDYTNIIARGTFVVLAAAQLTGNHDLLEYGRARMRRWAAAVDDSGSFAEYNSPTYTPFLLEVMARIRMYVRDAEACTLGEKIEQRAWNHFSAHWHSPTRQLAGPMSRCYHNDIASPIWLQKSLDNRLTFLTLQELRGHGGLLSVAILDYQCPAEFVDRFLYLDSALQHREVFISGHTLLDTIQPVQESEPVEPLVGTTWLTPVVALGSTNRSDFWNQRRPLLAYWGGLKRPLDYLQLRVMKDDYDFSSALFHSVQEQGAVLGIIGFRDDGGDKHPLIDHIQNGVFSAKAINVELRFGGWQQSWRMLVDGRPWDGVSAIPSNARISIDVGGCRIAWHCWWKSFQWRGQDNASESKLLWAEENNEKILRLTLFRSPEPQLISWKEVREAACVFSLLISDQPETLESFDARAKHLQVTITPSENGMIQCSASSVPTVGTLGVRILSTVASFPKIEGSYRGTVAGKPLPAPRLSDVRIVD